MRPISFPPILTTYSAISLLVESISSSVLAGNLTLSNSSCRPIPSGFGAHPITAQDNIKNKLFKSKTPLNYGYHSAQVNQVYSYQELLYFLVPSAPEIRHYH